MSATPWPVRLYVAKRAEAGFKALREDGIRPKLLQGVSELNLETVPMEVHPMCKDFAIVMSDGRVLAPPNGWEGA